MATIKQKLAFKRITENHEAPSRAMLNVGYDESTASKPSNLTNSKGFKQIMEDAGLTDDFLIKALHDDIEAKPKNRKPELELAFKVKGHLKEGGPPGGNTNTLIIIGGDQSARIARRAIARLSGGAQSPDRLPDSDEPAL